MIDNIRNPPAIPFSPTLRKQYVGEENDVTTQYGYVILFTEPFDRMSHPVYVGMQ
jgi:hypothetical protein